MTNSQLLQHIEENIQIITEDPVTIGLVAIIGGLVSAGLGNLAGRRQLSKRAIFGTVFETANEVDDNILKAIARSTDKSAIDRIFRIRRDFVSLLKEYAKSGYESSLKDARVAFVTYIEEAYDDLKDDLPKDQRGMNRIIKSKLLSM